MSRKYMAVIYAAVYFERWVENGLLANAVVTACLRTCRQDVS
ncbi:hypothetical protein [Parabacteroides goldsteinii]|nr:hypothetical protein [Parabacteroides goldsteinii]